MLKIKISDEARDYILEQTDTITLLMRQCGGWRGVTYEPAVYAGKPEPAENYHELADNGVKVFLAKDTKIEQGGISISITGEGMWRGISIQGMSH